jgi:large subunit ribosomal protein L21e
LGLLVGYVQAEDLEDMPKSRGYRRKTRSLFRKRGRRATSPLTPYLRTYSQNQKVVVDIDSSEVKGMPHRRFQGLVGTVREVRRRSLVLDVQVGGKSKQVITRFEHVKPLKG